MGRRIVRGTARVLVSVGVLGLLFVAYQLWGTGITHARDQRSLRAKFAKDLAAAHPAAPPSTVVASPTTTVPATPAVQVCATCVAQISIPRIGLNEIVVEGVGVDQLKQGVGHYPGTKLPGEAGNAALAGHRTTYGHPFGDLDLLQPGDPIIITTRTGTYRYEMTDRAIVSPDEVSVLDNTPDNRLTMTTCHPKGSAAKRMVVTARLVTPLAPPPVVAPPVAAAPAAGGGGASLAGEAGAGLSGSGTARAPAVAAGLLAADIWFGAWALGRRWGRPWTAYLVASPAFFVVLFVFFQQFASFVPANL